MWKIAGLAIEVIQAQQTEIEDLKREHEFICRKCGKRQVNPNAFEGNF